MNFKDSTSFAKSANFLVPYRINGTAVTSNAAELNILDGALTTYTELNYLVGVTSAIQTQLNAKQSTLVSGTNLKTVNGESLLGSGNIVIDSTGGSMVYPGAGIPISTGTAWGTSITNNAAQWDTAYVARNRWDGGALSLVPATGRTSLGGTTIGQNMFTMTNPDAIRFPRTAANNTWVFETAATFKTALSLTSTDVGLANVTNESKATMFTSPTFTGHPTIEGVTATGATGTGNLVFSASPTFTGTVTGTFSGNVTGNLTGTASLVTGFTRNAGTLTLSGGHGITLTTTGLTSVTLPTSGTLATTTQFASDTTILHNYFEARVDSIVDVLADTTNIETLLQIDLDTDTIADLSELRLYIPKSDTVTTVITPTQLTDSLDVIRAELNDTVLLDTEELDDLVPMLADTIPLFVFGAGGGNAADTAAFTTSTLYGAFYNGGSDTLKITEFRVVMIAGSTPLGTDTLAVQVYWNDSINVTTGASVTTLNSAVLGCNSTTTGTSDTSFASSKIPPNVWVFMKSPGVVTGRKPNMVVATLMGYKIPRY